MAKIFGNLHLVLLLGLVLAVAVMFEPAFRPALGTWNGVFQWLHAFFGITWIGLLYYFNFVQIPTMPTIPAELKKGVSGYIAPKALFFFRWAAVGTVVTGLILAWLYNELTEALTLQDSARLIGIGLAWALFNGQSYAFGEVLFHLAVSPALVAVGLAWALAVALLGGILPAIRAARLPVVDALRAT